MITDRVNHAHGLLAPFMPISEFAASVLKPEAFGFDHKSQFYEPIQFGVHVTGRANNSRGCMRIAVPVHENESNWLPLMKSRFARMINKPELIKQKLEFRTVDGRALDQFSIDELPHVGRLHAYANGTKLTLPSMPNVAIEYSSKKVDSLQSWINTMSDRLPDFMGDQLAGLDGPGIDNKMRPNGAFQASVQKFIMSSVDDWTDFVRVHNVNSPLSMNKDVALGVASNIASEVRNQMHGLLKSAQKAVLKHLASMESKRIKARLGGSDSEQHETLFSNTNDAVDAAHDHGSDLFCRLGDDLVASPLFQHTFMDNLYSRPLPVNGCRWDVEPGYHGSGGGRGGGGGGGSSGKEYRFNAKEAGTFGNNQIANTIHFELVSNENSILTVKQIRNILQKFIKNVTASIEMIALQINNETTKKHTDILMLVAEKQGVYIDTSKVKNFKDLLDKLAQAIYMKRGQKITKEKTRTEIVKLVMSKYPCVKMFYEASDTWEFDKKKTRGLEDLIGGLVNAYEKNSPLDVIYAVIDTFINANKTVWQKVFQPYFAAANKFKTWWSGEEPEDVDRLYYLSFVAAYVYCIDISNGPSESQLRSAIALKTKNDVMRVSEQWEMASADAAKYKKQQLEIARRADLSEKERDRAGEAAVRAAAFFESEDELEESIAESARIVSDDSKGKGEADGSAYVPDEGKDSPPPPPRDDVEEEDGDDSESGSDGKSKPVPTPGDGLPMFGDWKTLRGNTFTDKLNERHTIINLEDLKLIHLRRTFSDILLNPEISGKIKTDTFYSIAKLLSVPGVDPTTERPDLINKVGPVWSALPRAAPTRADSEHHPFNALIHATLEPALGQYPTYYKTLHTKEDMSAAAPYSGNVEETYKTYHALLGVPLNMQPGVFINCHGSPQVHRKDKKKKNRNYPTYRYDNNEAPLIDAPAMEMPALIPIARERSPVRGAGAVPKLIPIDKRVRRSRSRSRRSRSPKYEKMQAALPELVPIAPKYEEMESKLPELVPIQKALPKLVPMKKEFKTHMDFPDVDDIF